MTLKANILLLQAKCRAVMWQWHVALITSQFCDCDLIWNKVFQIIFLQNKVAKLRWPHTGLGWPPLWCLYKRRQRYTERRVCGNGDRHEDSADTAVEYLGLMATSELGRMAPIYLESL